jgi:hypothetical protein
MPGDLLSLFWGFGFCEGRGFYLKVQMRAFLVDFNDGGLVGLLGSLVHNHYHT